MPRWLEREHIDRSTLTTYLERDFELDDPAHRYQHRGCPLDECGVVRVEQPVELLASPQHSHEQASVEGREQPFEKSDGEPVCLGSFDPCDGRS